MSQALYRLGRFCFRRRWIVLVAMVVLLAMAGVGGFFLSRGTQNDFTIPGTESQQALDSLAQTFPEVSGSSARVIVVAPEGRQITETSFTSAIGEFVDQMQARDDVSTAISPFDATVTGAVSADGRAAIVTIQLASKALDVSANTRDELTAAGESLQSKLEPGSEVSVGGDVFNTVLPGLSGIEVIGALIALAVLLILFRSLLSVLIPLLSAVIGIGISAGVIFIFTRFVHIPTTAPLLAIMIGLAVGLDYTLFILFRHRDQLRAGTGPEESVARATATAGSAVVFAGLTVAIALVGLAVVNIPFLTVMGLSAALAVAVAVALALTVTPALLGVVGDRIHPLTGLSARLRGSLGLSRRSEFEPRPREHPPRRLARRWLRAVTRYPVVTILVVVAILVLLTIPARDLHLTLPDNGTTEEGTGTRRTYELVEQYFGPGYNGPLLVTANIIGTADPLGIMESLAADIADLPGVAAVPLQTPNATADTGIVQVIPTTAPSDEQTADLVREIRSLHDRFQQEYGVDVKVTGITAVGIDVSARLGDALIPFALLVVGLSLVLLTLVFRSLVVPVKAALGYLLSVGSAFGAVALVFDHGWLSEALGVTSVGNVISFFPIIVMGVLFGLAMDYEVFLVSRMREAYVHGDDARSAVEDGFASSALVVLVAATIMFAVFAAFVPEGDFIIKPLAFGLAVGVLVDALIVRMTLVPAVMVLLGKKAWWLPKWLDRALPVIDVEGDGVRRELELADWPGPKYSSDAVMVAEDLYLGSNGEVVYAGVTFDLEPNGLLLLHGPEGSGKTALLLTLAGRMKPDEGRLKVRGFPVPERSAAVRKRTGVILCSSDLSLSEQLKEALVSEPDVLLIDDYDLLSPEDRGLLRGELARAAKRPRRRGRPLALVISSRTAALDTDFDFACEPHVLDMGSTCIQGEKVAS